jgi:tRNA (cytidine56-2'-O)-methyltransferase
MGTAWKEAVGRWRMKGGLVVHLTVYGENIETSDVLKRVKSSGKDILIIVGSKKTPDRFFAENVSDFNIAIGNQPHSECASVAIFLDRFFEGKELARRFKDARLRIVSQKRGKRVMSLKPHAID